MEEYYGLIAFLSICVAYWLGSEWFGKNGTRRLYKDQEND